LANGETGHPGGADMPKGGFHVPKFMDIHHGMVGITPEALKAAHEGDLAIQGEEGVSFDHAWADPVSGTVFCISTGPSADAVQRLVDLLLREARVADAGDLTSRLARAYPSSPLHLSLAGEAALAGRRFGDAERLLAAALVLTPDAASVRMELARTRLMAGRPSEALDTLAGLPPSREVELVRGASLAARGDWPGAVGAFERALASGDPTPDLLTALGHAQLRAGRAADAARTLERSLALKPDQPQARELLDAARKQLR
jgi:tetratricopeptide (TPR) repeat protein